MTYAKFSADNAASILKLPVVLTSSMAEHAQDPLLSELEQILPRAFADRIQRQGIVNAMDDKNESPLAS